MNKLLFSCQSLFLVFLCMVIENESSMPPYIKPCKYSSPDFEQCAVQHGNEALPSILNGDKKFAIPYLKPLTLPEIKINAGKSLKIKLMDISVIGLDTAVLKGFGLDKVKKIFSLDVNAARIELIGKYEVDGKILVLPIQGTGNVNITAVGGNFKAHTPYTLETRKGEEYAQLMSEKNELSFTLERAYFNLDNLFNGNKELGDNLNKFLNDNWQDVVKELGGAIEGTVTAIATDIADKFIRRIPLKQLILE